jgi:hypothetical protein
MPTYVLEKDGEEHEVLCSFEEMKLLCNEHGYRHLIKAPSMVSDTKSTMTRAGSEWQEHLKNIKSKSGRGNTIKV